MICISYMYFFSPLQHNDPSTMEYQGFIRVHMCVQRPIHVSTAITRTSWYRLMRPVKERSSEEAGIEVRGRGKGESWENFRRLILWIILCSYTLIQINHYATLSFPLTTSLLYPVTWLNSHLSIIILLYIYILFLSVDCILPANWH